MNHYGFSSFTIEGIEHCPQSKLDTRERYWIKELHSNDPSFGYNMTDGGDGGLTWGDDLHKVEISERIRQRRNPGCIPLSKESLQNDISDNLSFHDITVKYNITKERLKTRIRLYFHKTPSELGIPSDPRIVVYPDKDDLLKDIKDGILGNKQLADKYNLKLRMLHCICKEYFGVNITTVRGNKLSQYCIDTRKRLGEVRKLSGVHRGENNGMYKEIPKSTESIIIDYILKGYRLDKISELSGVSKYLIRRLCYDRYNKTINEVRKELNVKC